MDLETTTRNHARGVEMASNGDRETARGLFQQTVVELKQMALSAGGNRNENANVLLIAPVECSNGTYSERGIRLHPLMAVAVKGENYPGLSQQEVILFAAVALYNLGCSYHQECLRRGNLSKLQRARNIYDIVLQVLSSHGTFSLILQPKVGLIFLAVWNNLAAHFDDTFERVKVQECLEEMRNCMWSVQALTPITFPWLEENLFALELGYTLMAPVA